MKSLTIFVLVSLLLIVAVRALRRTVDDDTDDDLSLMDLDLSHLQLDENCSTRLFNKFCQLTSVAVSAYGAYGSPYIQKCNDYYDGSCTASMCTRVLLTFINDLNPDGFAEVVAGYIDKFLELEAGCPDGTVMYSLDNIRVSACENLRAIYGLAYDWLTAQEKFQYKC